MVKFGAENAKFEIENADTLVLVDCFATWCGPCKMISPIIERISEKYGDSLKVVKVDIDEDEEFASKYGVMSIPTLLFFLNGKLLRQEVGFKPESDICKMIDECMV